MRPCARRERWLGSAAGVSAADGSASGGGEPAANHLGASGEWPRGLRAVPGLRAAGPIGDGRPAAEKPAAGRRQSSHEGPLGETGGAHGSGRRCTAGETAAGTATAAGFFCGGEAASGVSSGHQLGQSLGQPAASGVSMGHHAGQSFGQRGEPATVLGVAGELGS